MAVRRRSHDDDGSTLIIAMIVMFLLSTLALAGLARTLSVMTFVRHGQSYDTAHAVADAALHDALYRLDHGLESSLGWTVPVTELEPGKTFRYKVAKLTDDSYQVDAIGTIGDTDHAVRAVLKRGPGMALFSDDPLHLGGAGSGRLGLQLSSVLDVGFTGTPDPTHVGSNGDITIESGAGASDVQHLFLNAAGQPGACSGCPNAVRHSRTYPMTPVTRPPTATDADKAACDSLGGTFTGLIDGRSGQPYICERDVQVGYFSLTNDPLVIYVLPSQDSNGKNVHHTLDISGAPINLGGRAADLRIYKAGPEPVKLNDLEVELEPLSWEAEVTVTVLGVTTTETVTMGDIVRVPGKLYLGDVSFTGLLYAPETILRINADQWWKGAFLAKRIEADGSPLVTLTYDQGLQRFATDWAITNYSEIPTSEANVT